jgi:AraC family transcriptional regulator
VIGHLSSIFADELNRPSHPAQDLLIQFASLSLAAHLLRGYDTFGTKQPRLTGLGSRALSTVLSYIEEHVESGITLDVLAALANVSRFHFARLFRASTGMSPMAYVERSRLLRAQALIREAHLSLAHIASLMGFADQSHFTRRFRMQFGYTPNAYARHHGQINR